MLRLTNKHIYIISLKPVAALILIRDDALLNFIIREEREVYLTTSNLTYSALQYVFFLSRFTNAIVQPEHK